MITLEGKNIRWADHQPEYGSALAEYICTADVMRDHANALTGDPDGPDGAICLYGRRLLIADRSGVDIATYPTVDKARQAFAAIEARYLAWSDAMDALAAAARQQEART